jgi:hypothetical protein
LFENSKKELEIKDSEFDALFQIKELQEKADSQKIYLK